MANAHYWRNCNFGKNIKPLVVLCYNLHVKKGLIIFLGLVIIVGLGSFLFRKYHSNPHMSLSQLPSKIFFTPTPYNPLSIAAMRARSYPGSNIIIEQNLPDGSNYHQYLASYKSDGLKIYALLTVPMGEKPSNGWPVILFNHGYIPPEQYQTFPQSGQYASYYPVFAQAGYIVFKPDYRGNANSEGQPEGAYYSPAYAIDDLNALTSIKNYKDVNPNKIGVWAHSMGGNITLRDLVIDTRDIKAAVIWGGVVGSYNDLMNNWQKKVPYVPSTRELAQRNNYRSNLVTHWGTPISNPTFWNSMDPTLFVNDITAPIQLDAGESDEEVPVAFSQSLFDKLTKLGKKVEFYTYPEDNHNISNNFSLAMQHSLNFLNLYLK